MDKEKLEDIAVQESRSGSVVVIGGGVAGVQAALDLADSGYFVYLVEKSGAIGTGMAQLDKTFPTNDCSMCIIAPILVSCSRHANIKIMSLCEVSEIKGMPGNFTVSVTEQPRYVDLEKCISCGVCAEACPTSAQNEFEAATADRKAIFISYPQAVPTCYQIDAASCSRLSGKDVRCSACMDVCVADAVDFSTKEKKHKINAGAVIFAIGAVNFDPKPYAVWGHGTFTNVVTSLQFERYLSPIGPTTGALVRPSDEKIVKKIAFLQCIGSRDGKISGNTHCSTVCCMSALKEAILAKELALSPEVTIFFQDMRTPGKDFDRYLQQAREKAGIRFVRSRIFGVEEEGASGGTLRLRFANEEGRQVEETFDMVVLSTGMQSSAAIRDMAENAGIRLDSDHFAATSDFLPVTTSRPGLFVCGTFSGPKDINQSITEGSATSAAVAELLSTSRHRDITSCPIFPQRKSEADEKPRIGVFICHCGSNIAGSVDVEAVSSYCRTLPHVCHVDRNLFSCSKDTQVKIIDIIRQHKLNRIVIGACTPRTHEQLFRGTLREAGIDPFQVEIANIRNQCAWVHRNNKEHATHKAKELLHMAVRKMELSRSYPQHSVEITAKGLVVGGGVAGMTAALNLANQGFEVHLVETSENLGGNAKYLKESWSGEHIPSYLKKLIDEVMWHERIVLHMGARVTASSGHVGNFVTTVAAKGRKSKRIEHGVVIIASGGSIFSPEEYEYRDLARVVTSVEFDKLRELKEKHVRSAKNLVFIQCVGSREPHAMYCSKVCCTHSVKAAIEAKKEDPSRNIYILHREIRTYGQREILYRQALKMGIIFINYDVHGKPDITGDFDKVHVEVHDHILHRPLTIEADLVILATAIRPQEDAIRLARMFDVALDEDGFYQEAHAKLRPVDLPVDGVFVAGLAQYPKPIEESIAQALAASGRAATLLSQTTISFETPTAEVDMAVCDGCGLCVDVCPYHAINVHDVEGDASGAKTISINVTACKGCGLCQGTCPKHCIFVRGFSQAQIAAQIDAALT